jgi:hypothetical protein
MSSETLMNFQTLYYVFCYIYQLSYTDQVLDLVYETKTDWLEIPKSVWDEGCYAVGQLKFCAIQNKNKLSLKISFKKKE